MRVLLFICTTSGVSMPDWVGSRPSSDAAQLCANRRIYMTSLGNPTVLVFSTRQLLRGQQFAMVRMMPTRMTAGWTN
jgi:hypothetical protein